MESKLKHIREDVRILGFFRQVLVVCQRNHLQYKQPREKKSPVGISYFLISPTCPMLETNLEIASH